MRQEVFRMEGVTYKEQEAALLEDFNINIFAGEIIGLIPVNAQGLSCFLDLLRTNLPLYNGYVYYKEELINSWRESNKSNNRISIIGNKSCLVEGLTVADNIFVLRQGFRQRVIQPKLLEKQLKPFMDDIGIQIDTSQLVEKLSVFDRVIVELLRAIVADHRLIVIYELNTIMSDSELAKLYRIMKKYTETGFSFLYISPHFEEVLWVCNRVALMSDGRIEKVLQENELDRNALQEWPEEFNNMVREHIRNKKNIERTKKSVFELKNLKVLGQDFHLEVAAGECVVIQDIDNQMLSKVLEVASGDQKLEYGEIYVDGHKTSIAGNRDVALIQESAPVSMVFPKMSYIDNLCFNMDNRLAGVWSGSKIKKSIKKELAPILGDDVFDKKIEELTNRQKYQLVYNRIVLQKPKVVICIQPFKGADMHHRMLIWEMLEDFLKNGVAVIILTVNLADSLALADRLIRIYKNNMICEYDQSEFGKIPIVAPWLYLFREKTD